MYEPNVNIKNPVEINLLYVQARDGILDGTHPCTMEEACKVCTSQSMPGLCCQMPVGFRSMKCSS